MENYGKHVYVSPKRRAQIFYKHFVSFIILLLATGAQPQNIYNKIILQKTMAIGISQNYPPLNILDKNGQRNGIELEMIQSLAAFLDVKPVLVPLNVQDYVKALEEGRVQLIIAGMSRDLERSKKIWFSAPYLSIYPAALVDNRLIRSTKFGQDIEELPVENLRDLNKAGKLSFIVKEGSIYESLIKNEFNSNKFIRVSSNEEGLEFLNDFKANAFLHDSLYLEYLLKENPGLRKSFTLMRTLNRDEYLCVGIPFGEIILKNQIDAWIAEIIRTKKINQWVDQYLKNETGN
ncbi:MAG: transporter substrate-binding domain-containing protein [Spirochaetia bacterium]|nr:transporter substrate-binding domain-containing protein [Spirochaetia bacterium]